MALSTTVSVTSLENIALPNEIVIAVYYWQENKWHGDLATPNISCSIKNPVSMQVVSKWPSFTFRILPKICLKYEISTLELLTNIKIQYNIIHGDTLFYVDERERFTLHRL